MSNPNTLSKPLFITQKKDIIYNDLTTVYKNFALVCIITLVFHILLMMHIPTKIVDSLEKKKSYRKPIIYDGFTQLGYTFTDENGKSQDRIIRYKFIDDNVNDEYYVFNSALKACENLDSKLWSIQDGKDEWEAVINMAKNEGKSSVWINGRGIKNCPDGSTTCLDAEAAQGKGLDVEWPDNNNSKYTRLYTNSDGDNSCIYVDKQLLWKTGSCGTTSAWGLCIKR
ncbi:MAG: C-type lectin domain-containing protein [bacterium]